MASLPTPNGADADGVLTQAIRTKELRVRLPRHHACENTADRGPPLLRPILQHVFAAGDVAENAHG